MGENPGALIRIAVVSERRLTRESLCAYLDGLPDFEVVGRTASVENLHTLCTLRHPHMVLADTGPLRLDAARALATLHRAFPTIDIVVVHSGLHPAVVATVQRSGITALVPASRGLPALLDSLRQRHRPTVPPPPDGLALTDRELSVITLLGYGHSTPEIAELLGISPHTVENHKRRVYAKLHVGTRSQAVRKATQLGLIGDSPPGPQPRTPTHGRGQVALVVVHCLPGPFRDRVVRAVLAARLPVVLSHAAEPVHREHWARWRTGPATVVLVEPTAEGWRIPEAMGAPAVAVYSNPPGVTEAVDVMLRGADAVVVGDEVDDLDAVLSLVSRGYVAIGTGYADQLLDQMVSRRRDVGTGGIPELTARERDVLASIAGGDTIRQTARVLGIAAKTVENTQARLFRKLGTRNRAETLTMAYRIGLVDPTATLRAESATTAGAVELPPSAAG